MKRYLLFQGPSYYAEGGWGDYHGSFDTVEDARAKADKDGQDWWHVVDTQTGKSLVGKRGSYCGVPPEGTEIVAEDE